jgi:protease-4
MGWFTSRGSKMTDSTNPNWERELIARLANDALIEQRRRRRWGIFFKLLTFAYITFLLLVMVDWSSRADLAGGKKHTALVELNGIIAPGTDGSAERITTALQAAFKDKNTQGVIVRINSPGGSPVQAQTIYDEMRRLRKKYPDIPLYAVVEDICASGGYFVAVGADRIYVGKASIVGSIGVLMNGFGFTGLMDKLGIERRLITAGENKGMLDPFSPQRDKDKDYISTMMKDIHGQFIDVVREGRGKRLKETPDMFSGLIWTGQKSVELGLADGVGSLDSVARDVIKAEEIVDYTVKEGFAEKVAKRFGASVASSLADFALRSYFTPIR